MSELIRENVLWQNANGKLLIFSSALKLSLRSESSIDSGFASLYHLAKNTLCKKFKNEYVVMMYSIEWLFMHPYLYHTLLTYIFCGINNNIFRRFGRSLPNVKKNGLTKEFSYLLFSMQLSRIHDCILDS